MRPSPLGFTGHQRWEDAPSPREAGSLLHVRHGHQLSRIQRLLCTGAQVTKTHSKDEPRRRHHQRACDVQIRHNALLLALPRERLWKLGCHTRARSWGSRDAKRPYRPEAAELTAPLRPTRGLDARKGDASLYQRAAAGSQGCKDVCSQWSSLKCRKPTLNG